MSLLPTNKAMLQSLKHVQLEYPPFDFVHHNDRHYSNLGYSLLGIALERVSKMDFQRLVTHNILHPLGMTGSGCLSDNAPDASVAAGFRWDTLSRSLEFVPIFRPYSALYAEVYIRQREIWCGSCLRR